MDFETFKDNLVRDVKEALDARTGGDTQVETRTVDKMNETYDAITVKPEDSIIGVNLNATALYKEYEDGRSYDSIVEGAADIADNALKSSPDFDVDAFSDYSKMKDSLAMEVVSKDRTETTADDSEQYNESTSSTETSDDATSEASDYVDEDESLQYAYIGGLDDAMELVEAIQDKISAEDLVGISYVEYEFLYHAIDLRFYDENGYVVKTATNWYDPDPYKVYVNNYPIVVQEYYDDDDRVIIRFENFDTHVYEYNDDGFVSKETV